MTFAAAAGVEITGGGKGHPFRVIMDGRTYSLAEFCEVRGMPYNTVRRRMRNGQPLEKALALDMFALRLAAPGPSGASRGYHIGQVTPLPADANRALAEILMKKRGMIVARARSNGANHRDRAAKRIIATLAENQRLRTDPFEQARTFLRRKGFVPVARVENREIVGRHQFDTQAQVMDFARTRGWAG